MIEARVVRDFFLGKVSALALADASAHAYAQVGQSSPMLNWRDLDSDFVVSIDHLVRLCDAAIEGDLPADRLQVLAFGLLADHHFIWDTDTPGGERIGETLNDWSVPTINYALNPGTLAKFRHRLLTGEDTFTGADAGGASA